MGTENGGQIRDENKSMGTQRSQCICTGKNTLEAFLLAAEQGADGVELDVQLTKDGEMVVVHDEEIDRVSDGSGFVKDYTLAELKNLNFNKTHPEYQNVKIPTLREVYEALKPTGMTINVELKTGIFWYKDLGKKGTRADKRDGDGRSRDLFFL